MVVATLLSGHFDWVDVCIIRNFLPIFPWRNHNSLWQNTHISWSNLIEPKSRKLCTKLDWTEITLFVPKQQIFFVRNQSFQQTSKNHIFFFASHHLFLYLNFPGPGLPRVYPAAPAAAGSPHPGGCAGQTGGWRRLGPNPHALATAEWWRDDVGQPWQFMKF